MGTDTYLAAGLGVCILVSELPAELKEAFEDSLEEGVEIVEQYLKQKFDDDDFEFLVSMNHNEIEEQKLESTSTVTVFVPMLTDEYHGGYDGSHLTTCSFDYNPAVSRAQDLVERLKSSIPQLKHSTLPLQWVLNRRISM